MSVSVSPYAPNSCCPLLIAPDGQLEWSTRKPWVIPTTSGDKYHTTVDGDKLTLLASKYYRDFRLWWVIYDNNPEILNMHPMLVPAGVTLRIPAVSKVLVELSRGHN